MPNRIVVGRNTHGSFDGLDLENGEGVDLAGGRGVKGSGFRKFIAVDN